MSGVVCSYGGGVGGRAQGETRGAAHSRRSPPSQQIHEDTQTRDP